jgi:hypothetical protein
MSITKDNVIADTLDWVLAATATAFAAIVVIRGDCSVIVGDSKPDGAINVGSKGFVMTTGDHFSLNATGKIWVRATHDTCTISPTEG